MALKFPLRLAFGVKLGLAISLLSVGVTSLSVYFLYSTIYNLVVRQMADRLKDVGRTSTFLFNDDARDRIQRLKQKTEQQAGLLPPKLAELKPGETHLGLSDNTASRLMQTQDFQQLVQILRKVAEASRQSLLTPRDVYPQANFNEPTNPVQISTYLMVSIPESPNYQVVKFLASGFYEAIDDWAGNPIGNLYAVPDPIFTKAFATGEAQAGQEFYTDPWGTWLTAVVPIKDRSGRVVAAIGLDYDATSEINQVKRLQWICWSIIGASMVLSTLVAYGLAKWLSAPLVKLHQVARQVRDRNFDAAVTLYSKDELGLLAETFNAMVAEIRTYATSLRAQNQELETRVAERTAELQEKATQLEQTLKELQQTQIQMIQSERMSSLGQLVAGMAHEINNPVNFIHGNLPYVTQHTLDLLELLTLYQMDCPAPSSGIQAKTEAIDLEFLQEDLPKLFDSMKTGIDRIRAIIQALRTFSRLDEAVIKKVDLHESLDSTLAVLQNRFHATPKRPAIQIVQHYGTLPQVECYAGYLNQVLMHCLLNAIEALEQKIEEDKLRVGNLDNWQFSDPTITIRTESVEPEQVQITIADNGCGMTEATQKRIFDPFFTTKPVGSGIGIGLSISYQIITEQHGGTFSCRSKPGQGAEFIICLPTYQRSHHSAAKPV